MRLLDSLRGRRTPKIENSLEPVSGTYSQLNLLDALPPRARVDKYGAMFSSDFMACETVKARAIRSLPVHALHRGDKGRIPVSDHALAAVFHRPNALMSWGDLMAWFIIRRDIFGTAYIRVVRNPVTGTIVELRPVLTSVTVSFDRPTGIAVYSAGRDRMNDPWTCREDDLVIIKTDASQNGGIEGKSIVQLAADDIGLSIDLGRFYRALLENGNHFPGWLETEKELKEEDIAAVRQSLDSTKGPENAGSLRIFDRGLKYKEVQLSLQGMDLVEQERFVLEKVCRACHVDMHHVFADSKATATSASGYDIDFTKNTVVPEAKAIEDAFQPVLDRARSMGGKDSGLRVKLDVNGLLRGDFKTRMEGYRIGVYSGIFTRAYCATQEDIPWLPGQDKLLQPTAYYVLDEDGNVIMPAAATDNTQGQSDGVSGIDEKALNNDVRRLLPVIKDAEKRIEKRARSDGDCEKTREFARAALAPVELAAAHVGVFLNTEELVEESIERGIGNA